MIYTLDGELHLSDVPTPLLHQLIRELTAEPPAQPAAYDMDSLQLD